METCWSRVSRSPATTFEPQLAGFDDVQMAQYVEPPLTTVRVPMRRLGQVGFEVALRILDGESVRSRTLPTDLVIRDSTGPPGTPARRSQRR
jgi:DNA-binding LacI/PurR family transcriptional regulator